MGGFRLTTYAQGIKLNLGVISFHRYNFRAVSSFKMISLKGYFKIIYLEGMILNSKYKETQ